MFQLFSKLLEGSGSCSSAPATPPRSAGHGSAQQSWSGTRPGALRGPGTATRQPDCAAWLPGCHTPAGAFDSRLSPQHTQGGDQHSIQPVQPRQEQERSKGPSELHRQSGRDACRRGAFTPPRTGVHTAAGLHCPISPPAMMYQASWNLSALGATHPRSALQPCHACPTGSVLATETHVHPSQLLHCRPSAPQAPPARLPEEC